MLIFLSDAISPYSVRLETAPTGSEEIPGRLGERPYPTWGNLD